jgi:DNA repair exonuclease SbcCD nuclease subunit
LFDLLYQINEVAKHFNCTAIVQLGDFFHIKSPSRNSHELVIRAMKWARSSPCPVFVVPGNHDLSNDRLASLDEGQPLGVMFSSGAVYRAEGYLSISEIRDYLTVELNLPIYSVPWQQFWDAEHTVADRAVKDALSNFEPSDTPQLIVTHAPFFPEGSNPAYEHYATGKFARMVNPSGKSNVQVCYGHIHDWHGQYVVNGVRFANYGALSRGSLTESNLTRPVGVTIWDSITGGFEFVALEAKPAEQVFRVKEITEVKASQAKLDDFLTSVGQSTIEITSIESVMDKVRALKLGKEFEAVVEELLTSE